MENLPEHLLSEIIRNIKKTAERNSISLVCKRLYVAEAHKRDFLRVGCGLHPAAEALMRLCMRFPNLKVIEIVYSGWMSNLGKQLDNQGILVLPTHCSALTDLNLSFCAFINDAGLSCLASCQNLRSLKLNFVPAISSNGLLSIVLGCKNLSVLHLIRCMNVSSVEWLEYLGKNGKLEDLSIKNCRNIREDDLLKLGPGWFKLKRLEIEVDAYYRYPKVHDNLSIDRWRRYQFSCEKLEELSLVNCIIDPGKGLSCLFGKCKALEKLHLDMCLGVKDEDFALLSQKSTKLRSISICLPSQFLAPTLPNNSSRLSDACLNMLATRCSVLEVFELTIADGEFPSFSCFTQNGIISLIQGCPVHTLVFQCICFLNDLAMEALCSAHFLKTLELVRCHEVTDEGIKLLIYFPCLISLKLCKCLGVTDSGFKPLIGSNKLEHLAVEDCPQISEEGIQDAARTVLYKQDLSWLH